MKNTYLNPMFVEPILSLANRLSANGIPCTIAVLYSGLQLRFPWNHGDLICHEGSLGHTMGCVESYGCPWDNGKVSCLGVQEALELILAWYDEWLDS